jgi:translation initiation factor 2 beta subunit (eIF-2beta)/eIF-5
VQGGVIGGAFVQGILKNGDVVEIRPGKFTEHKFVDKKNTRRAQHYFTIEPLLTRVQTCKSGEAQLPHARPGGLIALATTLCPSLSADDGLQGYVLGLPGTLPPVWQTLSLLDLVAVSDASTRLQEDDEDSDAALSNVPVNASKELEKIEPGDELRLHTGSDSVHATLVKIRLKRGKLVAALHKPLCAELQSNVAIESKFGQGYRLVAHGRIADGTQCDIHESYADKLGDLTNGSLPSEMTVGESTDQTALSSHDISYTLQTGCGAVDDNFTSDSAALCDEAPLDLHDSDLMRESFVDELLEKMGQVSDAGAGLKIPPPDLAREGGAHCIWQNFMSIVKVLNRPPAHFLSFLAAEGLSCHRAGEGSLFKYTWAQQKRKPLLDELEEARHRSGFPTEEWERCLFITTNCGRQVRMSADLAFTKEHFPVEVSLKDAVLRIGSRGMGGLRKIYPKLCGWIRAYARTFVVCQQCRSACTTLERDKKLHHTNIELVCSNCSARRFVPSQFKLGA